MIRPIQLRFLRRNAAGFTLIELLVSLSILALLIGAGIPSFRRFGRVQQLDLAADQVKSAILDTRALALNPRAELNTAAAGSCADSTQDALAHHYTIQFTVGSSTYTTLEGSCVIRTGTLPDDIAVPVAPASISFTIGDASLAAPATDPIAVTLTNAQVSNVSRLVTVNRSTGAVSITVGS